MQSLASARMLRGQYSAQVSDALQSLMSPDFLMCSMAFSPSETPGFRRRPATPHSRRSRRNLPTRPPADAGISGMDGRGSAASSVATIIPADTRSGATPGLRRAALAGLERPSPSRSSIWDVSRRSRERGADDISPASSSASSRPASPKPNPAHVLWLTWDPSNAPSPSSPPPLLRRRPPWPAPS